jgi:hypothetical protein
MRMHLHVRLRLVHGGRRSDLSDLEPGRVKSHSHKQGFRLLATLIRMDKDLAVQVDIHVGAFSSRLRSEEAQNKFPHRMYRDCIVSS